MEQRLEQPNAMKVRHDALNDTAAVSKQRLEQPKATNVHHASKAAANDAAAAAKDVATRNPVEDSTTSGPLPPLTTKLKQEITACLKEVPCFDAQLCGLFVSGLQALLWCFLWRHESPKGKCVSSAIRAGTLFSLEDQVVTEAQFRLCIFWPRRRTKFAHKKGLRHPNFYFTMFFSVAGKPVPFKASPFHLLLTSLLPSSSASQILLVTKWQLFGPQNTPA